MQSNNKIKITKKTNIKLILIIILVIIVTVFLEPPYGITQLANTENAVKNVITSDTNQKSELQTAKNAVNNVITSPLFIVVWIILSLFFIYSIRFLIFYCRCKKKENEKKRFRRCFKECFSKEDSKKEPKTILGYFISTVRQHPWDYCSFMVVPFLLWLILRIREFSILSVWAFLITTLGAFYATKAERSSSKALKASNDARVVAEQTRDSVIHFADDLESFVNRVKSDLDRIPAGIPINVKFLTVIPAFGSVGLEEYYSDMKKRHSNYKTFHEDLIEKIKDSKGKLEILTHNGKQTMKWLSSVMQAQANKSSENIENDVKELEQLKLFYLEQKKYVRKLLGDCEPDHLDLRIWKSQRNSALQAIPFQFLILSHGGDDAKVYFLFSGSYLYESIFKMIKVPVGIEELLTLTKGYYVNTVKISNVFKNIFDALFDAASKNKLTIQNITKNYANIQEFKYIDKDKQIDITEEYKKYECSIS